MIGVRAGGVTTTIIGGLWAVLSIIFGADHQQEIDGFATGFTIAVAGAIITAIAAWMEDRR